MTETQIPDPYVASTPVATRPGRTLAGAVAVFLGGYLLVQSLGGQLVNNLAGFGAGDPALTAYLLFQLVFAVAAVVVGYLLAAGSASRKLVASVILVAGVVIVLAVQTARITGGLGPLGQPASFTLANPYFMEALLVGAGWLIVRSAKAGWLSILLVLILIPVPFLFAIANIGFAISQIVLLLLVGIVGLVTIIAGRPLRD